MNAPQQSLDRLHWLFVATLVLFAVFTGLFALSLYSGWQLDRAHERRYQSYLLADELRQSSDDLTRMVRSYIATGNPKYRSYYEEILAIRDGRVARPLHYNRIYWDLIFPRQQRQVARGDNAGLLELMQKSGFSELEFARLAEAKRQSDLLSRTERAAMVLADSGEGLSPQQAAPLQAAASLMVNDDAYFMAKARIMRPIDEVYTLIEQRTTREVALAARQSQLVQLAFMLVALGLCLLLLRMRRYSHEVLGGSLRELYSLIVQLGGSPAPPPVPARQVPRDTVMDWLLRTDERLRQMAQEQEAARQQLVQQANSDALTGLANRRALLQQLAHWLALPPPQPWGVAYLDLDGFKPVNDRYGHAVGDAVLQALAQQLARLQPAPLCAARMGGDEFVLLLQGEREVLLARMQQLVDELAHPLQIEGLQLSMTVSIGLLAYDAQQAPGLESVLRQADAAMYQAKSHGKRQVWLQRRRGGM